MSIRVCVALFGCLVGCGAESVVEPVDVTGSYQPTTFEARNSGSMVDLISGGGHLILTLASDRTFTADLLVPDSELLGEGTATNVPGTWSLNDNVVPLMTQVDTFLRDVPFVVGTSGMLTGSASFQGVSVVIELAKQ